MKICGIDEAGRGPVIGPLVVAGLLIEESQEKELIVLDVKDSKLLSPERREALYDILTKKYEYFAIVVPPAEVDEAVFSKTTNLNFLEFTKMAMIINKLNPDKAIIDAPSVNIEAFKDYVRKMLKKDVEIVAEHKADLNYPVVSAASIIAKVTRDRMIEDLKKKHNVNFGSGYPADPLTKDFLVRHYKDYDFFRKSWASYKNLMKGKQKSLGEY